ncbi:MAG: helix-turn-helix transcriptional regulator [Desulfobacteraceae bacterium]|nr:helix-turn-helix transcriptional regulator [Desulfobacteraceae bacterium]
MLIKYSVHERIKEINCLHNVTKIIMDQEKSMQQTFQAIVGCLPPAWKYPDITSARIVLKDQTYVSAGFKKTRWKQSSNILNGREKVGTVEVYYLKKMPVLDEGPFLKEERMLIDTVADHVANTYRRIKLEESLKERIKELGCFYGVFNVLEKHNSDYKKILKRIVDLLPDAWQYPEITCAKIIFKNEEFKTDNYKNSPWKQITDIKIGSQTIGAIEVTYIIEMPELDEGPFLKEERLLINAVSERISNAIKRIRTEEELRIERISLENKNVALKEVIERVQVEKDEIAKNVQANVDKIIIPIFSIIEQNIDFKDTKLLKLVKNNLREVTAPFTNSIINQFTALSPVEIQICDYIKNGFSTKDIAQLRGIAISTVSRHREHIRKKLNLTNKNINLVTYLNNFMNEKSNFPSRH